MAAVPLQSLLIFTNQFAAMIASQLPLVDVLDNLAKETPQRKLRDVVDDVCDRVKHGVDLGDALAIHPDVFNDIYVNVVRAGMGSGRLDDALGHLSRYLTNADVVGKKLKSALSYPIFLTISFAVAFNGLTFFLLPRFQSMFAAFGGDLPAATQVMLHLGAIWRDNWILIAGALAATVVAFVVWIANPDGRYLWDQRKLDFWVIGPMWRMAALARFLRTFAVQVRNEVDILDSLRLAAPASGNRYVEAMVFDIADDIERGTGIAEAFRERRLFSGIVLQMISSGEEAGSLDTLLLSSADYFDRLLDNQLARWTSLINPILTVILGVGIAGMMIAVFLPVFDMGSAMRH